MTHRAMQHKATSLIEIYILLLCVRIEVALGLPQFDSVDGLKCSILSSLHVLQ